MGSGAETAHETVDWLVAKRREGRRPQGPPLPPLRRRALRRRAAEDRARDRRARPHQGAGLGRRAAVPGRRHGALGIRRRDASRARRRRAVRTLLEGVHAGDGRGRLRGAREAGAAQPLHRRDRRRRHAHVAFLGRRPRHRAGRRLARGLLRPRLRRHGRRQPQLGQDPGRGDRRLRRRPTSSTTRRSRAPSRSRTCASRRARSARRISSAARASSRATSSSSLHRQDVLELASSGATLLLNAPYGPDELWDRLPREVQDEAIARKVQALRRRRLPDRARGGAEGPHQHDHADLLLRALRRRCRARRRSRRSRRRSRRPTRRRAPRS